MAAKMKAIIARKDQPLSWEDVDLPEPAAGHIRIKVAAAGLNRADILQRRGMYPPPEGAVDIMGLEVSGWVDAVGEGVSGLREGQAVCALLPSGGYAEYAIAHAGSVMPPPDGVDLVQSAGLPETVMTVWANVFGLGQLKPGETFLVQGGSSGIGTTAIQMARAHGARVFATAGSEEKCKACVSLGAEAAFNYKTDDFEAELKALGGVDVILDIVAGDYVSGHINILKTDGRLVHIAVQGGLKTEVNILKIMSKRLVVTGSTLRGRTDAQKAAIASQVVSSVWPQVRAGKVKPIIDSTFPMQEAEAAQARMVASEHIGKILLTLD